ncbi:glycosyltransferase [Mycobacterium sp. Marseille-P9652]|uniref:glycosyltransferase n=1 Tax=Mycobacterium sp. Marseille-P9652 TaxID=2654950 RepID=UPI001E5A6E97|nr:glycosyltransferase [Mycobacterium sp. Marseille-P9652]
MRQARVILQLSSLVPPARYGGAERVVGSFGEQLEDAGFLVHNRGLRPRGRGSGEVSAHAIPNMFWPFDGRRRGFARRALWHAVDTLSLSARSRVDRILDEVRPDVVISHNLRGWGYAPWVVAAERGIPLVHVVHDYGLLCNSTTLWNGAVCDRVCRPCAPRVGASRRRWPGGQIVGVSRAVLAEHGRRGLADFTDAVVVHPTAAAASVDSTDAPRATGVPSTVGYLGRVTDAKGVDVLLAAIERTDRRLIVAGEGDPSFVDRLRGRAPSQVEWRGHVDHTRFFDEIDVLVVPSVWLEPFGLVVAEAARAGVPVLIADRPGLVEAARVSGACHSTFRSNDVAALRAALERPLRDYRTDPAPGQPVRIADVVTRALAEGSAS